MFEHTSDIVDYYRIQLQNQSEEYFVFKTPKLLLSVLINSRVKPLPQQLRH